MNPRSKLYWGLSIVMLAWLLLMSAVSESINQCRREGGRWTWRGLKCRPLPAFELQRDIRRS